MYSLFDLYNWLNHATCSHVDDFHPLHPHNSFRMQMGQVDQEALIEFLGRDFNRVLTSVTLPSRDAPRACELLPFITRVDGKFKLCKKDSMLLSWLRRSLSEAGTMCVEQLMLIISPHVTFSRL